MNDIGRKITNKIIELHGSTDFMIAFLPYKRSMWNSMQSVYEECIASGIDAHVFPIPYYRMKSGRQVDYIDNDRDLFGDIAEDIDTLASLHPNYIVIHYQYQDHNAVTNMLPEYFTSALKERYHCKIIFIPYGIGLGEFNRHFIIQPGLYDIDYAFVESEENAQQFIEEWAKHGVDFTGRVFGYGSPKLDMATSNTGTYPEEWRHIIGDRPVTLVATSLSTYLVDPVQAINSYKAAVVNEVRDGNAVIFRPHPLLRTTINAMRSTSEPLYNSLMESFRNMEHVIIDESEYLENAFHVADKLVSDPSSLISMWLPTGKPLGWLP